MSLFLLIIGFVFNQPLACPAMAVDSLKDVIIWTFNNIVTKGQVDSAMYVAPQYCRRGWFKYGSIPYDYFPDPTFQIYTLPPILNDSGALFEGGVQVSELWSTMGWPCDNPYDSDHFPPYKIPDPVFNDFATKDADDSLYWQANPWEPITFVSIANENVQDYDLYWAMEQIDANVNALEFDVITGCDQHFSSNGVMGNNNNLGYDAYRLGTANFANRISIACGHGMTNPIQWFMPTPSASSQLDSAKYAFDDNPQTYWLSKTDTSHWLEIDFGRKRKVQQLYLSLYQSHILNNFSIRYWNDSTSNWQDFNPPINITNNTDIHKSFVLSKPVSTSKMRLFSSDSQVYLPEFQVFGSGFRQFLLKKYCIDSGWIVTDSRWTTGKLVNLSDTLECPDGTMNTFNFQKYLVYHNWTGNPFGGVINYTNALNPPNPLFLDWFPLGYAQSLVGTFLNVQWVVDTVTHIYMRSYAYQDLSSFWGLIADSVRNYAQSHGKKIYVTHNASCNNLPLYCDYLIKNLAVGELFPAYLSPSVTDTIRLEMDGKQAEITPWRLIRSYGLAGHSNNPPIVVFLDFGWGITPFAHLGGSDEPADERVEYLRTYVWEVYAAGLRFALPVKQSGVNSWKDTTSQGVKLVDILKGMTSFLNAHKDIYQDTIINSQEGQVKVNGIAPFNGQWNIQNGINVSPVNESKVTIAYINAKNGKKSYLHIINHNWDSLAHRMIPQDSVPVEILASDSCITVRVISPDFAGEDTLPFTYQAGTVRCIVPELSHYDVLILDFSTGVEENNGMNQTLLYQNYPNPFTQKTVIEFRVESSELKDLQLRIYDLSGRLVKSFSLTTNHQSLTTAVTWDGRNDSGEKVASGVYFYKLQVGNQVSQTNKLLLLR